MMNTSETPKDQLLEEIENEKRKRRDSNPRSLAELLFSSPIQY
jgi:hypothetical protein